MRSMFTRFILLGLIMATVTAGQPAGAMKPLSSEDLGDVTGMSGVSIYFKDIDATLLQLDDFQLDLTPDTTLDAKFRITDDGNATILNLGDDDDSNGEHSMAFCGSFTDENTPIDVDWLGFDIDIGHEETAGNGLNAGAVVMSMTGYGSTEMYWNWDLCQFVVPGGTAYDVFGLRLGELFWAEKYVDPNKHQFMYTIISPLSSFDNTAFVDSNTGGWHGANIGDIRSNTGVGGELGLRPGGGTLGFFGFVGQEATANSVMFAGDIIDRGDATTPYPNWQTFNATYYYSDDLDDWNFMGELVNGVHHQRTYTRTNYIGRYANGTAFNMSTTQNYAYRQIGKTSPTRPMRVEVATASRNADDRNGNDTYLIAYLNGHYARTVYYPDSAVSSMGQSTGGCVPTTAAYKNYIMGELRVGRFREANPDRDGDGSADIRNATYPNGVDHTGSWAVNDISVEYTKIVIPGNRSLVDEISTSSEAYIIPNIDYGDNGGAGNDARMSFAGNLDPATRNRTMNIATPFVGTANNPQSNFGTDRNIGAATWK